MSSHESIDFEFIKRAGVLRSQAEQQQALGTRTGLRRGLASQHSASRGSMERSQGPGPPPGLEGIPWPLTKEAAADLGLPAPDLQKVRALAVEASGGRVSRSFNMNPQAAPGLFKAVVEFDKRMLRMGRSAFCKKLYMVRKFGMLQLLLRPAFCHHSWHMLCGHITASNGNMSMIRMSG